MTVIIIASSVGGLLSISCLLGLIYCIFKAIRSNKQQAAEKLAEEEDPEI